MKELYSHTFKDTFVNINGEICSADNAKISVFDRGFLYGDSIYEVTYGEDYHLIFLQEHLERLYHSASLLNMTIFLSKQTITEEILKTAKASKLKDLYLRIILTRGETEISLDPNKSTHNNFIIIAKPKTIHPPEYYRKGLSLFIPNILRNDIQATNPNAKSGNYLNNVMAMNEAKKNDADDAIMINQKGDITEGTTFNVWSIKDGHIYTPPVSSGLLRGITREKIIEICKDNQLSFEIKSLSQNELLDSDEVFICSSTRGIMPVYKINHHIYGNDINDWKITKKLMGLYKDKIRIDTKGHFYYGQ